jgi:hypothetical protein
LCAAVNLRPGRGHTGFAQHNDQQSKNGIFCLKQGRKWLGDQDPQKSRKSPETARFAPKMWSVCDAGM